MTGSGFPSPYRAHTGAAPAGRTPRLTALVVLAPVTVAALALFVAALAPIVAALAGR